MATLINHHAKNRPRVFQEVICRELQTQLEAVLSICCFHSLHSDMEIPLLTLVITGSPSSFCTGVLLSLKRLLVLQKSRRQK